MMRRFGVWLALALLMPYVVFFGGGWFGIYVSQIRIVSLLALIAVFGAWAIAAWRRPAWRPRSVLMPAIVAIILALAASTLVSRFPRQSAEYLGFAVILAGLYLLLVRILADPFLRPRLSGLAVVFTLLIGGAFAVACVADWIEWWGLVGRLAVPPLRPESESLTFGNPSAVLTIVLLFWCSAVAVIGLHTIARRVLVGALALLTAFAIVVSGSRAGWFGVGVAIVVVTVLWLSGPERRTQARKWAGARLASTRGRFFAGGATLLAIAAFAALGPAILRRLGEGGEDLRLNYLLAAGRMFREAPILGTGPGTWVIQRVRYTYSPETDYYIPHAHNVYAQTFAELGIVGALAGVVLLVLLVRLLREAIRDGDPVRRRWGWAAAFAVVYMAAHQMLDFYMNMPTVLFAVALPVAWLDATSQPGSVSRVPSLPRRFTSWAPIGGLVAIAVALGCLGASELTAGVHSDATAAYDGGEWVAADSLAAEAVARDPSWPPYQLTLGLTAAAVGDHERAADAFRHAALADDLPEAWLDLAAEEAMLGDEDAARDSLGQAARLGLQRPAIAMAIGDLANCLGDAKLSTTAFAAAIATIPSLAGDPWWRADPYRAAQFAAVIDAAIDATTPEGRWQIALMAGDPERANSLLPATSYAAGPASPPDVIDAWQGDDGALARILAACDAHPLDPFALAWASHLERRRGNTEAADRYLQWNYIANSEAQAAASDIRVSNQVQIGRTIAGRVADFWGTYTYRRHTPWNPLVPSLIQLSFE